MNLKKISFDELDKYNKIEMLKEFDYIRDYRKYIENSSYKYNIKKVPKQIIDFAKDESMALWKRIINQEKSAIYVIEVNNVWVAGCVVVTKSIEVNMLEKDMTNACLWDLRVDSKYQNKGYGSILFKKAIEFAKMQNCKRMIIETQNNNPKAIEFYEKQGAILRNINFNHYEELPDEDQLIFIKEI